MRRLLITILSGTRIGRMFAAPEGRNAGATVWGRARSVAAAFGAAAAMLAAADGVRANTFTYDWHAGGNANWSTPMNWANNFPPVSHPDNEVIFDLPIFTLVGKNTNQDIPNLHLRGIAFAAGNQVGININGNTPLFLFNYLTNNTAQLHKINVGVTLAGINGLVFNGTGGANGKVQISGVINGSRGIIVNHGGAGGGGTLELKGTNTFGGGFGAGVEIAAGQLLVGNNSALGSGMLTISGGAIAASDADFTPPNIYEIRGNFTVARDAFGLSKKLDLRGDGKITGFSTVTVEGVGFTSGSQQQEVLALTGALTATAATDGLKFVKGSGGRSPVFRWDRTSRRRVIDESFRYSMVTIGREGGAASPDFQGKLEIVGIVLKVEKGLGSGMKMMAGVKIGHPTGAQNSAVISEEGAFVVDNLKQIEIINPIKNSTTSIWQQPRKTVVSGGGGFFMDSMAGLNLFIEGLTPGDGPMQYAQLVMDDNGPITLFHDIASQTRPILYTTLSAVYNPDVGDRYKIIDQTSSLAPRLDAGDNLFQIDTNGSSILSGGMPGDPTLYDGTMFENGDGITWRIRYGLNPGVDPGATSADENDVFLEAMAVDCNGNGIYDDDDIAAGASQDCNANGVPDECEPECNGNAVPDGCDIAAGTSQDCNINGVPDECEPDCNGNSVADACDIATGSSDDCNGDGVPNECEPDCNGNSVPDVCDIAAGSSDDCNGDGVPNECDIAAGTSQDCNANGVPDECDPDCNTNGIPDDCEQPGPLDGFALDFDGVDDFVGVAGFSAIAPTTEITVEIWQKVNAVRPQLTLAVTPDALANRMAAAVPSSDGRVYWDLGNTSAGGRLSYLPPEPIVGTWQHFAFTASQSGNFMRIYRNGVLEAVKTGMDPREPGGGALMIGGLPISRFGGEIDEVRIWNMARTQGQIQSTMNTTLNGDESGLLAYWRFDEGSGTLAADSAGNSAGMLVNGPSWVALYADYNANGVPDECESDCNPDGGMDLSDYNGFVPCLSGPDGGLSAGCECSDLDVDGDVDFLDFAEFQVLFTG